ncbi:hypothetical protein [Carboxylicivirga marina]|uniref:HK97 gp10 family phage protein n=1 Tax=Carboxylicivirga marina TaxID=2800988 RepID=A0ABS1HGI7_9BACT|nr:hypothetical protein [Carboxylicivirga marina]MBK3516706.1 hypothetical protein [Carboxylicivirga marina]
MGTMAERAGSKSKKGFGVSIDAQDFVMDAERYAILSFRELLSVFNRSLSRATVQTIVKEARRDLKRYLSFSEHSTGETARSLGVKSGKKTPIVLAGARITSRYNGQLVHILDQGTDERTTKKNGANRGRVLGLNFYLEAMKAKGGDLEQKFNIYLKENYLKRIVSKV